MINARFPLRRLAIVAAALVLAGCTEALDAPALHVGGNVLSAELIRKGDAARAIAEAEVVDNQGKVVATASGSLLIFPLEKS